MNSWKIILAAVVIFCAGVITGSLLVNQGLGKPPGDTALATAELNHPRPPGDGRGPGGKPEAAPPRQAERKSKEFVSLLDRKLHLTLAQSNNIARIVAEGQERSRVLWSKVRQEVNQQIRAELTPEQLKQFEVLMKQLSPRRPSSTNGPPRLAEATNLPPAASTNPPPGS
jgi:hypothetical protein